MGNAKTPPVGTDINGRPYAKIASVGVGDMLIADGGFSCIKAGLAQPVYLDADGILCVSCRHGGHGLNGQVEGDHYIGFYDAKVPA